MGPIKILEDIKIVYCDDPIRAWYLRFYHVQSGKDVEITLFDKNLRLNAYDSHAPEQRKRAQELAERYLNKFYPGWEK